MSADGALIRLFTSNKDSRTRRAAARATVLAARRGTVCGEVGRVPRLCSTQHPHPLGQIGVRIPLDFASEGGRRHHALRACA